MSGDARPALLHILAAVHALGALACFAVAAGSAASTAFRDALVVSEGSAIMARWFDSGTWAFLLFVGLVLAALALASWRKLGSAWHLTLAVYGIGVPGSFWKVSTGIPQGWISATVNGAVVASAAKPAVRRAYRAR